MENYSLSYLGFPEYSIDERGNVFSNVLKTYMCQYFDNHGYLCVIINKDNKIHSKRVHRLVALTFIPNPQNKPQVNHKDGDKTNNEKVNLEWVTNLENSMHAVENGLMPHSKINKDQAHVICQMLQRGDCVAFISKELKVPYFTVSAIRLRRNWTHISVNYKFPKIRFRSEPLDKKTIKEIGQLVSKGFSNSKITAKLNISYHVTQKVAAKFRNGLIQ